jgi:hypothetical protein
MRDSILWALVVCYMGVVSLLRGGHIIYLMVVNRRFEPWEIHG